MKRTTWLIVGGVALLALLGGAAYVGGKLLGRNPSGLALGALFSPAQPGSHRHAIAVGQLKPAPELPQTPADVLGIFDHVADRSIYVKSSSGPVSVWSENGQTANDADGPVVEVVVNQDTKIYRDTTEIPSSVAPNEMVQQTVAEGSLDEIGQNVMVKVWGRRTGDRIVATTLEYNQ